jgi:glycosyltransferase involved in cell wall biosynthesis
VRILFLSPYLPSQIRVRPYHWVRSLVGLGHEVHLVALKPPEDAGAQEDEMRRLCAGVDVFPLSRVRTALNAAAALPSPATPLQVAYSHHREAQRRVARLAASGRFDVAHIEHMRGVALTSDVRETPIVYDAVDSISALFDETVRHAPSVAQRLIARLDLGRSRRFEARVPYRVSRVVLTSQREAAAFVALAGEPARRRLSVVPNGVDTEYFRPIAGAQRRSVVFTGKLSYHANAAAAIRLVARIMPLVWGRFPETPVILAGKGPPEAVKALARDPRVSVTGYVDDMRTVLAKAAVAVCPLVYGAGIQNKVLEALASGVPAVMTVAASEALAGVPGRDYIAVEGDDDFADAVLELLEDGARRRRLGEAGLAYVRAHHQWPRLAEQLVRVYEDAMRVA